MCMLYCVATPSVMCTYIRRTDREQIRSRINNNCCRMFRPRRPLSTEFCMQLTKAYVAETSCISCYWFCYLSAYDQFARYWQRSNEPLRHQYIVWRLQVCNRWTCRHAMAEKFQCDAIFRSRPKPHHLHIILEFLWLSIHHTRTYGSSIPYSSEIYQLSLSQTPTFSLYCSVCHWAMP